MAKIQKYCKAMLKQLARETASKTAPGDSALILQSSSGVDNLIELRCTAEKARLGFIWIEVTYLIRIAAVNDLWAFYSGRNVGREKATCSLQIRDVTFPGYDLPDWGFSLPMDQPNEQMEAIQILKKVIIEKIWPIARTCTDLSGVVAAMESYGITGHKVDNIFLYALAGMAEKALEKIREAKAFWLDPENGFGPGNVIVSILEAVEVDLHTHGDCYASKLASLSK